ncbi:MAG TPA: hypothetical protein VMH33_14370 [Solirubrobacterales bacterium]|nr:hypothetical protein [Solirubrobacterales bacterium]
MVLAIALAVSGALAYLTFWAYYWSRLAGETASYLVIAGSLVVVIACLWTGRPERDRLRALGTPIALWALGSAFLVFFGFMYGGTHSAISLGSMRFAFYLPSDNDIPSFFTEWFFVHGHHGVPPEFPGEWLASDRPPLQIGYALQQRPLIWGSDGLDYQIVGVAIQQLWIIGLWALLDAAKVRPTTRALIMVTVLFSDVAIVNGFFVWPKMLSTAMLLAVAALLMTPLWKDVRRDRRMAVLAAVLAGLALLSHGSAVFGLIPLALIALYRGLPSPAWFAAGIAALVLVMVPWSAYQKWGDPPGNRLERWMLGGRIEAGDEGTLEAIETGYREAGLGGTLHNKADNLLSMVGAGPGFQYLRNAADALRDGHLGTFAREVRQIFFFLLLPSLGLLLIAPVVMLIGRRRRRFGPEWDLAISSYWVFAVGAVLWGLILFGSTEARSYLHQGSYLLPILGLCAGVAGMRAVYPRFAAWFAGVAAALMLLLYVPALEASLTWSFSPSFAVLAIVCAAAFCAVAFGLAPRHESTTG